MIYTAINDTHITHSTGNPLCITAGTEIDGDQVLPESLQFHLDIGNLQESKITPVNATTQPLTENGNSAVKADSKDKVK